MKKYRFIFLIFTALFIVYAIQATLPVFVQQKPIVAESNAEVVERTWTKNIGEYGPTIAYQQFKESYKNSEPSDQHYFAHVFGAALYKAKGLAGLPVCDLHFSSGCFHELLGRALYENGETILSQVDQYCKQSTYDCQHGIGHGILAYSGYEYTDLINALGICKKIQTTDIRDGCFGGIFMEYNMRTMVHPITLRTQKPDIEPHSMCTQVPQFAVDACYFWIAQWFIATIDAPLEEKFIVATKKCHQIQDTSSRLNCYSGIANEFPSYTTDMAVYEKHCSDKGLSLMDPYHNVQCRAAVASILFMDIHTRQEAPLMCATLQSDELVFCEEFAERGDGKRIPPFTQWIDKMH